MFKAHNYIIYTLGVIGIIAVYITADARAENPEPNHLGQTEEIIFDKVEAATLQEQEDVQSYQLKPGQYVPEESMFLTQKPEVEDVLYTMSLMDAEKKLQTFKQQLDSGIEETLHLKESYLSETQLTMYQLTVTQYKNQLTSLERTTYDPQQLDTLVESFHLWVDTFSRLIEDQVSNAIANNPSEPSTVNTATNTVTEVESVENFGDQENVELDTQYVSYGIPTLGDQYLTYMPYTAITARSTPHYRLQQVATTDSEGYRTYAGARCIALASSYGTKIGTLYEIDFADGKQLTGILCDNKSDAHTDVKNQYRDASGKYDGSSGNILEIVFDTSVISDMRSVNKKINSDYPAKIIAITKIGVAKGF